MCQTTPYAISASGLFLLLWSTVTNNPFPYIPLSSRFFVLHNNYLTVMDMDALLCASTDGNSWSSTSRITKPPLLSDSLSTNAIVKGSTYYLVTSNGTLWTGSSCTSWTSSKNAVPWKIRPRHGASLQLVYDGSSSWLVYGGGYNPTTYNCYYDSYSTLDGINWYKFTVPDLGPACRFRITEDFNSQYYLLTESAVYSFQGYGSSFYFDYENSINGPIYSQIIVWEEYTTIQNGIILDQHTNSMVSSSSSLSTTESLPSMAHRAIQTLQSQGKTLKTRTQILCPGNSTKPPILRNTIYVWMSFYAIDNPMNPQPPHNRYSFSHDMSTWNDESQLAPYQPSYNGLIFINNFPSTGVYYFFAGGYTLANKQGMFPDVWSGSAVYYDPSESAPTMTSVPSPTSSRTPSRTPSASPSPSSSPSASNSHSPSSSPSHSSSRSSSPTARPSSCPYAHYGPFCSVCPGFNPATGICNGHGECIGEGTALGDGTCVCFTGWTGPTCADAAGMSTGTEAAIGASAGVFCMALLSVWYYKRNKKFHKYTKPKGNGLLAEKDDDDDNNIHKDSHKPYIPQTKNSNSATTHTPAPSAPYMDGHDPIPFNMNNTQYTAPNFIPTNISRTPTLNPADAHEITTLLIDSLTTIKMFSHTDDILPTIHKLVHTLDDISPKIVGTNWESRNKLHTWLVKLRNIPAHEILSNEDKTQLYSDVEFTHQEYGRLLRIYYRNNNH